MRAHGVGGGVDSACTVPRAEAVLREGRARGAGTGGGGSGARVSLGVGVGGRGGDGVVVGDQRGGDGA